VRIVKRHIIITVKNHANDIAIKSETKQNDDIECAEATISNAMTKHMFVDAQKMITMIEKEKPGMECEKCFQIIQHNCILESSTCVRHCRITVS